LFFNKKRNSDMPRYTPAHTPRVRSKTARRLITAFMSMPIYNASQKTRHPTHVDNFAKYWSIFKIRSLIDSEQNFLQNTYRTAHYTLQMLLHYLVKNQCSKIV